jgi:LCP family protein required for cell wall assembly
MPKKLVLSLIVLGIGGIIAFISYYVFYYVFQNMVIHAKSQDNFTEIAESVPGRFKDDGEVRADIVNIALLGIDAPKGPGRSDAIIVLTLDYKNEAIKLSSFMRDLYVNVHGYGRTKLGHAYMHGGGDLAIRTLNENYGLNIEKYIAVNFSSFAGIIDMKGGLLIDIDILEKDEINKMAGVPAIENTGEQLLNGRQALAYTRIRSIGNADFERTERQRRVLEKAIKKITALSIEEASNFLVQVANKLDTNIEMGEAFLLFSGFQDNLGEFRIRDRRFPADGTFRSELISGIYYLIPLDENEMKNAVRNFIYTEN